MSKLRRMRRIAMTICGVLIFITVVLLDRFGASMLPAFLLVTIGTAVVDYYFARRIRQIQEEWQRRQPLRTEWATVISRRVAHTYTTGSRGSVRTCRDDWCITFQTDRSGEIEMIVPRDVYLAVQEGKRGLLKHQGVKFHSFT